MASRPKRARKPVAPKTSKKMAGVRPLRGEPAIGRPYHLGFKPPPEKSPWIDEGRPEASG